LRRLQQLAYTDDANLYHLENGGLERVARGDHPDSRGRGNLDNLLRSSRGTFVSINDIENMIDIRIERKIGNHENIE